MSIHNKRQKKCSRILLQVRKTETKKKKKSTRAKQGKKRSIICDHVNKCFKYSEINLNGSELRTNSNLLTNLKRFLE